jgi:hypothetical protein
MPVSGNMAAVVDDRHAIENCGCVLVSLGTLWVAQLVWPIPI